MEVLLLMVDIEEQVVEEQEQWGQINKTIILLMPQEERV
jgi:hypothetical protein